jgi:uncharacterized protein
MSFTPAERLPRVVLDSNVWIDILVFDDPRTRPIAAALADRRVDAVIDARCRAELARVLDYPQFARFAVDKEAALAQVDGWTTQVALPEPAAVEAPEVEAPEVGTPEVDTRADGARADGASADGTRKVGASAAHTTEAATSAAGIPQADKKLPQCRDRDDQKFLELAHRSGAGWLVSKDRELLRMAKRIARDFGFSIGLPAAFNEAHDLTAQHVPHQTNG